MNWAMQRSRVVLALPTYLAFIFSEQFRDGPPFLITMLLPAVAVLGFFGLGLAAFATDIPSGQRRVIALLSIPPLLAVAIVLFLVVAAGLAG
jgi:hypothetical protein